MRGAPLNRMLPAVVVLASLTLGGCSSGGGKQSAKDAGQDSGQDAAQDRSEAGVPTNDQTCQEIRLCVAMCNDGDLACADTCASRGSVAARALYQAMMACTVPLCTDRTDKLYCGCEQQCTADAPCGAEGAACIGGATDLVCNGFCVGGGV